MAAFHFRRKSWLADIGAALHKQLHAICKSEPGLLLSVMKAVILESPARGSRIRYADMAIPAAASESAGHGINQDINRQSVRQTNNDF